MLLYNHHSPQNLLHPLLKQAASFTGSAEYVGRESSVIFYVALCILIVTIVFMRLFLSFVFPPKVEHFFASRGFTGSSLSHLDAFAFPGKRSLCEPLCRPPRHEDRAVSSRGLGQVWDIAATRDSSWDVRDPGSGTRPRGGLCCCNSCTHRPVTASAPCLTPSSPGHSARGHAYGLAFPKAPPRGACWGARFRPDLISVLPKLANT